jgi:enamine deaminase RidA (YjgF/YER057c/UK114 family)
MDSIDERLIAEGVTLPDAPAPAANYVPFVKTGNLVFVSGQLPMVDGECRYLGRLGDDVDLEEGVKAARLCAINILAQVKAACDGDLSRVTRVVRLGGFVASTPEFEQHPTVINGASDLMAAVFGEAGAHARAAVGVAALPRGVSVEVEGLFEVSE